MVFSRSLVVLYYVAFFFCSLYPARESELLQRDLLQNRRKLNVFCRLSFLLLLLLVVFFLLCSALGFVGLSEWLKTSSAQNTHEHISHINLLIYLFTQLKIQTVHTKHHILSEWGMRKKTQHPQQQHEAEGASQKKNTFIFYVCSFVSRAPRFSIQIHTTNKHMIVGFVERSLFFYLFSFEE